MGSNSTQAIGVTLFLAAFALVSAGFMAGGSALLILLGIAALGGSSAVLFKAKPWEHKEE
jgi:hypothetical protein